MAQRDGLSAFLHDLGDAFREGCQSAQKRADFLSRWNAVRIRTSGWDNEVRELKVRYDALKTRYEESPFSCSDWRDRLIVSCGQEVIQALDGAMPSDSILNALINSAKDLLNDEVFFTFPDVNWQIPLTLDEGVALRRYLDRKERFLSRPLEAISSWTHVFVTVWAGLLRYLPDRATSQLDDERSPISLSASIAESMNTPAEAIERLLLTYFDEDVADRDQFSSLRVRLEHNLYVASGISPRDAASSKRSLTLPTKSKLSPLPLAKTYLAGTPFEVLFETNLPVAVPAEVRFEHCHIVGGTGHGKTQLMQLLIHHDLQEARRDGRSIVVIDSQGDLIRTISHLLCFDPRVEKSLADRLMLIDPNDIEFPLALNMFDVNLRRINTYQALEREKILNGTIELYEYIFGALLGAELTQKQNLIFRYLARLMLVIPGANIHTLRGVLEDGAKFSAHFSKLDGTARQFFETEFMRPHFQATKTQALRRLWGVLANPAFERMFSHKENKVDLFDAMNSGKIILINTAKDLLKQEGCEIFGRFFIAMIAQAALQRAAIPADERRDTFVYIDEAPDYFDERIEHILSQARKYRVALALSQQTLDQSSPALRASTMANTSIKFVGGLSAKDAKTLAPDMHTTSEFLQGMRKSTRQTEFACFIKNTTTNALKVSVPLGVVNELPRISENTFAQLVARNRELYCAQPAELSPTSQNDIPAKTSPQASEPLSEGNPVAPPREPDQPDHNTRIHRRIQNSLKAAAQSQGLSANIEDLVLDGAGIVDVAIMSDALKIACEISVTTKPEHELHNVEKCIAAGFEEIWMISADSNHLSELKAHIIPELEEAARSKLRFLKPEEALIRIAQLSATHNARTDRVFGYEVIVERKTLSEMEREGRRQALRHLFSKQKQTAKAST